MFNFFKKEMNLPVVMAIHLNYTVKLTGRWCIYSSKYPGDVDVLYLECIEKNGCKSFLPEYSIAEIFGQEMK